MQTGLGERECGIGQAAAVGKTSGGPETGDRAALPRGELVIYESTEVFKLFFRLFTEGTT